MYQLFENIILAKVTERDLFTRVKNALRGLLNFGFLLGGRSTPREVVVDNVY